MRTSDTPYDRYRRDAEELMQRLDESHRVAEDVAAWKETRQALRERGVLDSVEASLRKLRAFWIRSERKRGKSLRDARLHADDVMARVRKLL